MTEIKPFRLACMTTDESGECVYAEIEMSLALATRLLRYRPAFTAAAKAFDVVIPMLDEEGKIYKIELWDYTPGFYSEIKPDDHEDFGGQWLCLLHNTQLTTQAPGDCVRLAIREGCVLWYAYHKHGGPEFETETLSWEVLEAVVKGENPFGVLKAIGEDH